jgi:hypothetical protein
MRILEMWRKKKKKKKLLEETRRLSQEIGKRPTVVEIQRMIELAEELIELGHWPAHYTAASYHNRLIEAKNDWRPPSDVATSPESTKVAVIHHASLGLLNLDMLRRIGETRVREVYGSDGLEMMVELRKRFEMWSRLAR